VMLARAAINNPWVFRELSGRGSGTASSQELDEAQKQYSEFAQRFGTKEKYRQFHAENFTRIRSGTEARLPQNTNLQ
jgi:tRNA-dihydrouridine synthase